MEVGEAAEPSHLLNTSLFPCLTASCLPHGIMVLLDEDAEGIMEDFLQCRK